MSRSCQRRLMPSATWSIRGQGRLWRILPREAALPQIESCLQPEATGVSDVMMAIPTAPSSHSRRCFRLRAVRDGIMTTAETSRIWSDVGRHWCENNLAGSRTASIVCCSTRRSTKVAHARGEDEVLEATRRRGGHCVTDDGVHSLQFEEGRSAVVSMS